VWHSKYGGVLQWTCYVQVASGSGQTGKTDGKCWFLVIFTDCTVHNKLFR
jgi:hypothetical protein